LKTKFPQRLKAGTENKAFVAAVNGCATQEQEQMVLFLPNFHVFALCSSVSDW
jgi:hypothetical protein